MIKEDAKLFKESIVNNSLVTIKQLYSEFHETIDDELRALGFVRLKPGQVVAEYAPCNLCGGNDPKVKGIYLGKPCDGHQYLKLVEMKE